MGFFSKRAGNGTRRASRLWRQQFRQFGIYGLAVILACGSAAALWKTGSFAKIRNSVAAETLGVTAHAGFRVDEILVSGRAHIAQDDLLAHLGVSEGMPLFAIDLDATQKNLAQIAWVKNVTVSRRLPGRVAVEITERTPVALWQYQKKVALIDAEGVALTSDDLEEYKSLPLVVGADAGRNVAALLQLLRAEPAIAGQISSAVRVGNRRWDLHLKNDVVVRLPEHDAELALSRLALVEEKDHILGRNVTQIDLRLPDRMVVEPGAKTGKENI